MLTTIALLVVAAFLLWLGVSEHRDGSDLASPAIVLGLAAAVAAVLT
jgi:hypothetical protein